MRGSAAHGGGSLKGMAMIRVPLRREQLRARMWATMRVLRRFSVGDLMATAGSTRGGAHTYLWQLRRGGYVWMVAPGTTGTKARQAVYVLTRDSGPLAPRVRKDGTVRDLNLLEAGTSECRA